MDILHNTLNEPESLHFQDHQLAGVTNMIDLTAGIQVDISDRTAIDSVKAMFPDIDSDYLNELYATAIQRFVIGSELVETLVERVIAAGDYPKRKKSQPPSQIATPLLRHSNKAGKRRQSVLIEDKSRHKRRAVGSGVLDSPIFLDSDDEDVASEDFRSAIFTIEECQCCFDEFTSNLMVGCEDGIGHHLFCHECVGNYVNAQVEQCKCQVLSPGDVDCAAAGGSLYTKYLAGFLDPEVLKRLEKLQLDEDLRLAAIEGLEECPFCDYKAILPPVEDDKEMRCQNLACGEVSCRLCRKPSHTPMSCDEVVKDRKDKARHIVEEAMTEALIRNCNNCKQPFLKIEGCNKMTCPKCGNKQCYVCRKTVESYAHFSAGGCPQTDNTEARHEEEVKTAYDAAIKRAQELNPDMNKEDVDVKFSEKVNLDTTQRINAGGLNAGIGLQHDLRLRMVQANHEMLAARNRLNRAVQDKRAQQQEMLQRPTIQQQMVQQRQQMLQRQRQQQQQMLQNLRGLLGRPEPERDQIQGQPGDRALFANFQMPIDEQAPVNVPAQHLLFQPLPWQIDDPLPVRRRAQQPWMQRPRHASLVDGAEVLNPPPPPYFPIRGVPGGGVPQLSRGAGDYDLGPARDFLHFIIYVVAQETRLSLTSDAATFARLRGTIVDAVLRPASVPQNAPNLEGRLLESKSTNIVTLIDRLFKSVCGEILLHNPRHDPDAGLANPCPADIRLGGVELSYRVSAYLVGDRLHDVAAAVLQFPRNFLQAALVLAEASPRLSQEDDRLLVALRAHVQPALDAAVSRERVATEETRVLTPAPHAVVQHHARLNIADPLPALPTEHSLFGNLPLQNPAQPNLQLPGLDMQLNMAELQQAATRRQQWVERWRHDNAQLLNRSA